MDGSSTLPTRRRAGSAGKKDAPAWARNAPPPTGNTNNSTVKPKPVEPPSNDHKGPSGPGIVHTPPPPHGQSFSKIKVYRCEDEGAKVPMSTINSPSSLKTMTLGQMRPYVKQGITFNYNFCLEDQSDVADSMKMSEYIDSLGHDTHPSDSSKVLSDESDPPVHTPTPSRFLSLYIKKSKQTGGNVLQCGRFLLKFVRKGETDIDEGSMLGSELPPNQWTVMSLGHLRRGIRSMSVYSKSQVFCYGDETVVPDSMNLQTYLSKAGPPSDVDSELPTFSVYFRKSGPRAQPSQISDFVKPTKPLDISTNLDLDKREGERRIDIDKMLQHKADFSKLGLQPEDIAKLAAAETAQFLHAGELDEKQWQIVLRNCNLFHGWYVDIANNKIKRAPRAAFRLRSGLNIPLEDESPLMRMPLGKISAKLPLPGAVPAESTETSNADAGSSEAAVAKESSNPPPPETSVGSEDSNSIPIDTPSSEESSKQPFRSDPNKSAADIVKRSNDIIGEISGPKTPGLLAPPKKTPGEPPEAEGTTPGEPSEAEGKTTKTEPSEEPGSPSLPAVKLPTQNSGPTKAEGSTHKPEVKRGNEQSSKWGVDSESPSKPEDLPSFPSFVVNDDSKIEVAAFSHELEMSFAQNNFSMTSLEVAASGVFKKVSVGASGGFKSSSSSGQGGLDITKEATMFAKYMFPRTIVYLRPEDLEVTNDLKNAINKVRISKDINDLRALQQTFGQLFCQQAVLGGCLQTSRVTKLKTNETWSQAKEQLKVEAGISVGVPNVFEGSAKFSRETGSDSENKKRETSARDNIMFEATGGNTVLAADPPKWCSSVLDYSNWRVIDRSELTPLVDVVASCATKEVGQVGMWFVQAVPPMAEYVVIPPNRVLSIRLKLNCFIPDFTQKGDGKQGTVSPRSDSIRNYLAHRNQAVRPIRMEMAQKDLISEVPGWVSMSGQKMIQARDDVYGQFQPVLAGPSAMSNMAIGIGQAIVGFQPAISIDNVAQRVIGNLTSVFEQVDRAANIALFSPAQTQAPVIVQYEENYQKLEFKTLEKYQETLWQMTVLDGDLLYHGSRVVVASYNDKSQLNLTIYRNEQGHYMPAITTSGEAPLWRVYTAQQNLEPNFKNFIRDGEDIRLCWEFKDQTAGFRDFYDDVFGRRRFQKPTETKGDRLFLKLPFPGFQRSDSNDGAAMLMSEESLTTSHFETVTVFPMAGEPDTITYNLFDVNFRLDLVDGLGKAELEDYMLRGLDQQIKPGAPASATNPEMLKLLTEMQAREAFIRQENEERMRQETQNRNIVDRIVSNPLEAARDFFTPTADRPVPGLLAYTPVGAAVNFLAGGSWW